MPTFPDVPIAPGVPPLLRNPLAPVASTALLVTDAVLSLVSLFFTQWGVFLDGAPVLVPDTMASIDFKQEWKVANYPIEGGGFESYDKVETPYEAVVRMAVGGSVADRAAFLAAVEAVASSMSLYDIVTPETTYSNANVTRYGYHRSANAGVGMLVIDLWFVEVRVAAAPAFTSTASPSGATAQSGGLVTPTAPTPAQQAAAPSVQ